MSQRFILNCPPDCNPNLAPLVSRFILEKARQVHLVGPDSGKVETLIDQTLKRSGSDLHISFSRFEDESLATVVAFDRAYGSPYLGEPQVVYL
jgi:hypothetical protein